MRNKRRLCAIALLAIICVGSVNTPSRAGTVSGTVEGTADISIEPIFSVQPPGIATNYQDVPSVLTYSFDISNPNPALDFVQFAITNSVYSFDTASLSGYGQNEFGPVGTTLEELFFFSDVYHVYGISAGLQFSLSEYTLLGGGYDYITGDTHGDGQQVITLFTPLSEPSSLVLAACGPLLVLAVALGRARPRSPYRPRNALTR